MIDCVGSIHNYNPLEEIEIIVVDNHSQDNSRQQVLNAHPDIKWIDMGYNSGFARANNAGISSAQGSIVLLLNSDTLCKDDTIIRCFKRLEKDNAVAAGVQLLNTDGSPQISGNYVLKGGLNYLMSLPYLGKWIRQIGLSSGVKKTNIPNATATAVVDWINGAFLMVKKSEIEKAGYLDEDFFLYSEEAEWCSRLKKEGVLCIYGDLHITHLEGGSSGAAYESETRGYQSLSDKKGYQILLSNFVRFRKEFGLFWYLFHLAAHLFTIPVFLFIVLLKTIFYSKAIIQEWRNWKGYASNVIRSLTFFPEIVLNKRAFYKVL